MNDTALMDHQTTTFNRSVLGVRVIDRQIGDKTLMLIEQTSDRSEDEWNEDDSIVLDTEAQRALYELLKTRFEGQ
jgi:hypothetical protein